MPRVASPLPRLAGWVGIGATALWALSWGGCEPAPSRERTATSPEPDAAEASEAPVPPPRPLPARAPRPAREALDVARPTVPSAPIPGKAPNVILIVVDTMRADVTSLFPDRYDATPFIAEIARKGVVYNNAYSTSSWTVPAMYSLMTGLYPSQHGMTAGYFADDNKVADQAILPQAAYTLTEQLRDLRYATFGVCTNQHLAARYGMGQGFDEFVGDTFQKLPFPDLAVEALAPSIDASSRYFLWLHYFDPHHPYGANHPWFDGWNRSGFPDYPSATIDVVSRFYRRHHALAPTEPLPTNVLARIMGRAVALRWGHPKYFFAAAPPAHGPPAEGTPEARYLDFLKAAYASEVARADDSIRRVAERLRFGDDDLVIVVSDHGEELMEHGGIGHRWLASVSQELIHVPLLIKYPRNAGAGRVVQDPVSIVDILPTIRAALGQPPLAGLPGVDLGDRGAQAAKARALFCELVEPGAKMHCAVEYPWKLVRDEISGATRLYDLSRDPQEDEDLAAARPEIVERLGAALAASTESGARLLPTPGTASVTGEDLARLRSLGYVD